MCQSLQIPTAGLIYHIGNIHKFDAGVVLSEREEIRCEILGWIYIFVSTLQIEIFCVKRTEQFYVVRPDCDMSILIKVRFSTAVAERRIIYSTYSTKPFRYSPSG